MADPIHEAMKLAVRREFGIDGIDDPSQLREVVGARLDTMDAAERAAFEMQLDRAVRELAAGGPPKRSPYIIAVLIFATLAWFVWRPLAAIAMVYAIAGGVRAFALRHALFWAPIAALLVGLGYGLLIAALVIAANAWVFTSTIGHILFGVFGLYAVAYVGYTVGGVREPDFFGDEKRTIAQSVAATTYLVSMLSWYGIRALMHR
ncbi:MAG: hypothetical protein ACYCVL_13215 [Gemmatimonadaceae bacterium]